MKCSMYTSGIANGFPIEDLKLSTPDKLIFSLYSGERKIHNRITRNRTSFEKTTESIRRSIDTGIVVELHCVITTINLNHLDSLMEFAEEVGINKVSFLRLVPQGRTNFRSTFLPDYRDYLKLRWIFLDLMNRYKPEIRLGSPFNILHINGCTRCTSGDRMVINSQGVAFPCDALKGVKTLDPCNVKDHKLIKIMEENELFNIMRSKKTPPACCSSSCEFKNTCAGGCMAQRLYSYGIFGRDPACAKNYQ